MSDTSEPLPASVAQRAAAVKAVLVGKGLMAEDFAAEHARHIEQEWISSKGARLVARAWTDPAFRERLLVNGKAVVADGKPTNALPGQVLRGPGYKPGTP